MHRPLATAAALPLRCARFCGGVQGRYSFVGAQPSMEVIAQGGSVEVVDHWRGQNGATSHQELDDPMQVALHSACVTVRVTLALTLAPVPNPDPGSRLVRRHSANPNEGCCLVDQCSSTPCSVAEHIRSQRQGRRQ